MSRRGRRKLVIPFLLPALLIYSVVFVYPAVDALRVSLYQWTGFTESMVYVGFGNYERMLTDPTFRIALRNTLYIAIGGGIGIFGLALLFAAIMRRDIKGKRFFRALFFFPVVIPGVGVGLIWQFVYNNSWGPLSALLELVGLESLDRTWLGPQHIMLSLTVAVVWTYVGFYLVILMAGIDKIPETYFEAARIDGASEWQMFRKITIPMIWDVLTVAIVLWIISALKIFDLIIATTFPSPPRSSYTMTIYVWERAVGAYTPTYQLGYATALGVVLLVLVLVSVGALRLLTGRESVEY